MNPAGGPSAQPDGGPAARAFLAAIVAGGGLIAFAGLRPTQAWLLFFTAGLIGLATAGTVRGHPRMQGRPDSATVGAMLLPVVCVIAAGAFADRVLEGYARVAGAGVGAVLAGVTVFSEYHSVDPSSRGYGSVRIVLATATYATTFAIYAVMFQDTVDLVPSVSAIGIASWLLAASLVREGSVMDMGALLSGFAVGVSLAELRAVLYFFPVDGVLGGAVLLVGFHVAVGVVHHLLDRTLSAQTVAEYGSVAVVGVGAVIAATMVG